MLQCYDIKFSAPQNPCFSKLFCAIDPHDTRQTADIWGGDQMIQNDTWASEHLHGFYEISEDINTSNQFICTNNICHHKGISQVLILLQSVTIEDLFLIINKVNFEAILPLIGAAPPAAHLDLKELDWNKAEVSRWPASLQSTPHSTWTAAESVKRRGILCQRILNE